MKKFQSENSMTRFFSSRNLIASAFGYDEWMHWQALETKGLFGIPDQLMVFWKHNNKKLPLYRAIACEMKIAHWRRALVQAYRYKAFAHYSIVVMDHLYIHRACKYSDEFVKANIGLAALSPDGSLDWIYRPKFENPYSDVMRRVLHKALIRDVFSEKFISSHINKPTKWNVR